MDFVSSPLSPRFELTDKQEKKLGTRLKKKSFQGSQNFQNLSLICGF